MDIVQRPKKESDMAKAVSKWMSEFRPEFESALDPIAPSLASVPEKTWTDMAQAGEDVLRPLLLDTFLAQLKTMMSEVGIEITWGIANQYAVNWAKNYTYNLVSGLNETTRQQLQAAISDFYAQPSTFDDITAKLTELFGPARAERIAITETTRAAVEGERAYIDGLEAEFGMKATPFWHTAKDDYVCRDCASKDGQQVSRHDVPPLHPGCRCFIDWEVEL